MATDYEEHLKTLRKSYYEALPHQRLHVAKQRIDHPNHGPNLIVTYVSSIEGLLRSLVIWGEHPRSGRPSETTYEKYRRRGVKSLFSEYLKQRQSKRRDIVTDDVYRLVGHAVDYRNLLAHECTYLGQDKYPELIDACDMFLKSLARHAGLTWE